MRDTAICLKLNPVVSHKPRVAIDAACDVARRIGCHVEININGGAVVISPIAAKGEVFQRWADQEHAAEVTTAEALEH